MSIRESITDCTFMRLPNDAVTGNCDNTVGT